jgi:hypothetical protein
VKIWGFLHLISRFSIAVFSVISAQLGGEKCANNTPGLIIHRIEDIAATTINQMSLRDEMQPFPWMQHSRSWTLALS